MIAKSDLEAAIAECKGKRNPDSKTCIMLAAFLTIRKEIYGEEPVQQSYSYAPSPYTDRVELDSESEFARIVNGMSMGEFLAVMDELMSTLQVIQPRLYNAVLDKLA